MLNLKYSANEITAFWQHLINILFIFENECKCLQFFYLFTVTYQHFLSVNTTTHHYVTTAREGTCISCIKGARLH